MDASRCSACARSWSGVITSDGTVWPAQISRSRSSWFEVISQHFLGPVNFLRDVVGRQADDVADGRRIHAFEIQKDHVAIDRFELPNQLAQPFGDGGVVVAPLDWRIARPVLELL